MGVDLFFIVPGGLFIIVLMVERLSASAEVSIRDNHLYIDKSHRITVFGKKSIAIPLGNILHISKMSRHYRGYRVFYKLDGKIKNVSLDSFELDNVEMEISKIEAAMYLV